MTTPAPPKPRVPDLPPRAVPYQQVLRGPRHRWWRPVAAFLVALLAMVVVSSVAFGGAMAVVSATGGDVQRWLQEAGDGAMTPGSFLMTNLTLAGLVPVTLLAVYLGHGVPGRHVISVVGRFRWRWFVRCLGVLVPVWAAYLALGLVVDGVPAGGRHRDWLVMLVIVLLTTPLQCAGEEFFFRGWALASVGSWFRHPVVGLVVGTVVSAVTFGAAHGSFHPWMFADLAVFAVAACVLTWRTGGLEAALALHIVNNASVMILSLVLGGFDQGFVDADTEGSPWAVLVSVVVMTVATALVLWQARRTGVQRLTTPQIPPPPWVPAAAPTEGPVRPDA